jgi:hypothetical protein
MAGKKITQLNSGSLSNLPLSGVTAVVYSGLTLQHTLSDLRLKLVDSGSHNFTGSQLINGDLTITGSVNISGSAEFDLTIEGRQLITGPTTGQTPQLLISSSDSNTLVTKDNFVQTIPGAWNVGIRANTGFEHGKISNGDYIGVLVDNASYGNTGWAGPGISGNDPTDSYPVLIGFQSKSNWTDGRITLLKNTDISGSLNVTNSGSFNIAYFQGNNEYYGQVNIKNTNSGSNSSTDLVLTANNGTETNHYVDLGINSSTYGGGLVGGENDAYLLNVGKDLYIGTIGGSEHPAKLFLFAENNWENPQVTVHTGSQITFNTPSFTEGYMYEFSGSVKLQDELKVDGSVTASYFIGDGSQLTNLPVQSTDVSMFLSSSTFTSASASFDSRIIAATNEQDLSYFATTGSNVFSGNQTISGSLVVSEIVSTTAPAVGDIASASETGINYLTGELTKWAIFSEDAFTIGVWTDVQPGWTVTDNNGFTDIIAGRGSFGAASFQTTVNNWPSPASGKTYVFTAPDYQPESANPLEVTVGDNDWVFGVNGGLTFPDETIQTTAYIPAILVTTESFNSFSSSINTTTSSLNTFSASVNGKTGSFATTGSNVFSGNQIVTGSFDVTSFLNIGTGNGDEGGEMMLVKPITNTNISGSGVIIDAYRDRIRIFEQGGATRGAFLDITKQSNAVSSQIVTSPNLFSIQTITSASYASLTPVSGTLYIIID